MKLKAASKESPAESQSFPAGGPRHACKKKREDQRSVKGTGLRRGEVEPQTWSQLPMSTAGLGMRAWRRA